MLWKKPSIPESTKISVLEQNIKNNRADRKFYEWVLGFIVVVSGVFAIDGYLKWYKHVQPKQDELLNLQIEKMKREIQVLEKQLEKKDTE